jgi:hypothetical protein
MHVCLNTLQLLIALLTVLYQGTWSPEAYSANPKLLNRHAYKHTPDTTRRPDETPHNYVYRAVSRDDMQRLLDGQGIISSMRRGDEISEPLKHCPSGSGSTCAICHVGLDNKRGSDFISTSRSMQQAGIYDRRGMVRIDLSKIDPSLVFDMTDEAVRKRMLSNMYPDNTFHEGVSRFATDVAVLDQEVLIRCFIPPEAITPVPAPYKFIR